MSSRDGDGTATGESNETENAASSLTHGIRRRCTLAGDVVKTFARHPFSGDALTKAVGRDEENEDTEAIVVQSQSPPVMWQADAPVVVSQFTGYCSQRLPQYWTTTVPELQKHHGGNIRYEHHDVPMPTKTSLEYTLATIGRAVQYEYTDAVFWQWFNRVMIDGVGSVDEAYDAVTQLEGVDDVDRIRQYVDDDAFRHVFEDTVSDLLSRVDSDVHSDVQASLEDDDSVFMVFVNGVPVQPSYDVMAGVVSELTP